MAVRTCVASDLTLNVPLLPICNLLSNIFCSAVKSRSYTGRCAYMLDLEIECPSRPSAQKLSSDGMSQSKIGVTRKGVAHVLLEGG